MVKKFIMGIMLCAIIATHASQNMRYKQLGQSIDSQTAHKLCLWAPLGNTLQMMKKDETYCVRIPKIQKIKNCAVSVGLTTIIHNPLYAELEQKLQNMLFRERLAILCESKIFIGALLSGVIFLTSAAIVEISDLMIDKLRSMHPKAYVPDENIGLSQGHISDLELFRWYFTPQLRSEGWNEKNPAAISVYMFDENKFYETNCYLLQTSDESYAIANFDVTLLLDESGRDSDANRFARGILARRMAANLISVIEKKQQDEVLYD